MIVAEMPDSDAWRLLQPARCGGRAAPADEFVSAVAALAARDGSAGWLCAMVNAAAYQVAGLPEEVGDEIWGSDPAAIVAAGHQPTGRLARRGARWLLTGRWHGVAAAERADWLLLTATEDGVRYRVLVPRGDGQTESAPAATGLPAAGICDVRVAELAVAEQRIFSSDQTSAAVVTGAGAAAAVTGAAYGLWQAHVDQVRERLATSYGNDEISDQASTRQVARAASDIDAATLQVAASLSDSPRAAARAQQQAVSRARDAADQVLAGSHRHALDTSDPVTRFWQDVHAGCRLTLRLLDGFDP